MGNPLKKVGEWLAAALMEKATAPLAEIKSKMDELMKGQAELAATVDAKHSADGAALECDLAVLDERICYLIGKCREKGYTTASDRRIIDRLHYAYKDRGGNHGEDGEYATYKTLPTEEEWRRMHEGDPG